MVVVLMVLLVVAAWVAVAVMVRKRKAEGGRRQVAPAQSVQIANLQSVWLVSSIANLQLVRLVSSIRSAPCCLLRTASSYAVHHAHPVATCCLLLQWHSKPK